ADDPSNSASRAATLVMPHDLASTMPKLHNAKTWACGRLKCGKWVDTVSSHCDNAFRRDMTFLLLLWRVWFFPSEQIGLSLCFLFSFLFQIPTPERGVPGGWLPSGLTRGGSPVARCSGRTTRASGGRSRGR